MNYRLRDVPSKKRKEKSSLKEKASITERTEVWICESEDHGCAI